MISIRMKHLIARIWWRLGRYGRMVTMFLSCVFVTAVIGNSTLLRSMTTLAVMSAISLGYLMLEGRGPKL
jgi:hypothetical protein